MRFGRHGPAGSGLLAAALALVSVGCGSGHVAPVSGQVTLDGEPVANARVTFQPLGSADNPNPGPGSYGITGADGRYQLTQVGTNRSGAVVGPHRVSIQSSRGANAASPDAPPRSSKLIPKEYNTASTLRFDVPKGGTTAADFALRTSKTGPS
jgi:hypothetical protein